MLKLTTTKGTKLTNKPATLTKLDEKGFLLYGDEGDDLITLELIKEHFLNKEVKITIEEIERDVVDL